MHESKTNRALILLRPSLLSGSIVTLLTIYIVVVTLWTTASESVIIKQTVDLLFEKSRDIDSLNGTKEVFTSIFSSQIFNRLFFVLAWAIVGILVYIAVLIALKVFEPVKDILSVGSQVNRYRTSIVLQRLNLIVYRILLSVILAAYIAVLFLILVPIAISNINFASSFEPVSSTISMAAALFILFSSFHIVTILIRMFARRIRVFGGSDYSL